MNVIVNADDLGMSPAVNDAIFKAFDDGLLRSTSVLVHGPAFGDAVTRLRARPELRAGVHLDTTEFHSSSDCFRSWTDQVRRARDAGIEPSHLDSHQHMHLRWGALVALARVVKATGVRAIRGRSLDYGPSARSQAWRVLVGRFAVMPEHYLSMEHWLAIGRPERPGVTEIMVHPGNPHNARYAVEMVALAEYARGWCLQTFDELRPASVARSHVEVRRNVHD